MEEIIKELNELIDIASMSEEQYLEYHRNKFQVPPSRHSPHHSYQIFSVV